MDVACTLSIESLTVYISNFKWRHLLERRGRRAHMANRIIMMPWALRFWSCELTVTEKLSEERTPTMSPYSFIEPRPCPRFPLTYMPVSSAMVVSYRTKFWYQFDVRPTEIFSMETTILTLLREAMKQMFDIVLFGWSINVEVRMLSFIRTHLLPSNFLPQIAIMQTGDPLTPLIDCWRGTDDQ